MGIFDNFAQNVANRIIDSMGGNAESITRRKYYTGDQRRQLKVPLHKTDDNLIVNLVGLAVDRSVSHVLAGGVEFELPDPNADNAPVEGQEPVELPQQAYIDNLYEVNKKSLLLLNLVINGSVFGTGYIKIVPDGMTDPYSGEAYPRLIALNPEYLTIKTYPQDQERVTSYIVEYTIGDNSYRETTRLAQADDYETPPQDLVTWMIVNEIQESGKPWRVTNKQDWPYNFPNIVHGKNLPSLGTIYGSSDIDDIIGMQDKSNATISYIQKQVRLQQHKQPWGRGIGKDDKLDVGPDSMIQLKNENAEIGVMDFQTDIAGSLAFSKDLRQSIFDVAREVDITSITDKLGALTNFGLRVLYSDSLGKCDTKRLLLGEMLLELNRRLLVLKGWEGEASRPGECKWNDPLPVNKVELYQGQSELIAMGIVSKQTISEADGFDWEKEQLRISGEKSGGDNAIGAAILKAFNPIGGIGGQ
jgi:hypothetical protein